MQLTILVTAFVAVSVIANAAAACEPVIDERTLFEIRSLSKPVAVDPQCRVVNGGVYDELSLGPAIDLDKGRILQVVGGSAKSHVLLVDCNDREATVLRGTETITGETSCGPISTYADLAGGKAMMSLDGGANLQELVTIAAIQGVTEIKPSEFFFMFSKAWESELHAVGRKDRFDLLCGCKLHYPDSKGARN